MRKLTWHEEPRPEELPVISVCDLFRDLQSHRGKRIAVRGGYFSNMENAGLSARPECAHQFETGLYRWDQFVTFQDSGLSAANFNGFVPRSWPRTERQTLPLGATRELVVETIVGVLYTRDDYEVRCIHGEWFKLGFGHEGAAPAAIAVEAILNPVLEQWPWGEARPEQACPPEKAP